MRFWCDTALLRCGVEEAISSYNVIVMQRRSPEETITVPVPDHKELRIGTLQSIIRQSGIARREFEVALRRIWLLLTACLLLNFPDLRGGILAESQRAA